MRKEMSFQELVDRVATRGGITEEGVKIIRQQAPMVFDKVLEVTLAKHEYLKGLIREQES
jgi:pyrroline-5-carboxylate reductase